MRGVVVVFRDTTFLPIAEKYGLIGEIDQWVIEQAEAFARGLADIG